LTTAHSSPASRAPDEATSYDWSPLLFHLAWISIALVTLFPYQVLPAETAANRRESFFWWFFEKGPDWRYLLANAALFVPFGFGLGWRLGTRGASWSKALAAVCAASFAFSFAIELTQNFMPTRTSSWLDVLANTAGGVVGWILQRTTGDRVGGFLSRRRESAHRILSVRVLAAIFVAYAAASITISIPLARMSALSNWDASFPFLAGNSVNGNHPWQGRLLQLGVADRAMTRTQAEQAFRDGFVSAAGGNLVASYALEKSLRDELGNSPALQWKPREAESSNAGAQFTLNGPWLQSEAAAAEAARRIRGANQFTIYAAFVSDRALEPGLNPIVALGFDEDRLNFLLGQFYSTLVLLVRTPLAPKGDVAEYRAREFFEARGEHRVLVTYDGATLRSYLDGKPGYAPELGPGVALFRRFVRVSQYHARGFNTIYYGLVFVPLGCILAWTARIAGRIHAAKLWCGLLLPGAILEPILGLVARRPFHAANILWAACLTLASFWFVQRYLPR